MSVSIISYSIIFLLISGFDYYRYKTIITPYIILTLPLLFIITFVNTAGQELGFISITDRSILLFNLFTLGLWLGSMPFHHKSIKIPKKSTYESQHKNLEIYYVIMVYIAIISSLISLLLNWNGIAEFFNSEVENNYGRGLWGHLAIIGYPAFIMLFPKIIKERSKKLLLLFIIFMVLSLFYQSKTRLFFMIFGGIFHYLLVSGRLFEVNKVIKQFFVVFIIAMSIFISIYLLSFLAVMGKDSIGHEQIEFIINDRFLNYAVGPVISCSENFELNNSFEEESIRRLFTVPYNLFAFFAGKEYTSSIRDNFIYVSSNFRDNAGTLFIYPFEAFGIVGTFIFMLLLGAVSYYSFIKTIQRSNNALLFSVLMTSLFLGFFGFFYSLLYFYEILLWGYIIPLLFKEIHNGFKLSIHSN